MPPKKTKKDFRVKENHLLAGCLIKERIMWQFS